MVYKSGHEWYMNKDFCNNLQNMNKTGRAGVCESYWSGDLWLRLCEKAHIEETAFEDM